MELAASREEFERAARLRDQIESFEKAQKSTQGNLSDDLDGDFIAIHEEGFHAAGSIFMVRRGSIKGSRSWIVDQERTLEGRTSGHRCSSLFMEMVQRISLPPFTSMKNRPILTHSLPGSLQSPVIKL